MIFRLLIRGMTSVFLLLSTLLMGGCKMIMFDAAGPINKAQQEIIILSILLMLLVVVPVIILTLVFSWKYRASNTRAKYTPDWHHSTLLESIWWAIPCIIILILAIITWVTSYSLDPYRPLEHDKKPLVIQVVSLDWKWLFIYPEQKIATVNQLQIPIDRPIEFKITSDAPMNSLWIPQIGSQIMSMPGMQTQLNLISDRLGTFKGYSANFSGGGFSNMSFDVLVKPQEKFDSWVKQVRQSLKNKKLNKESYVYLSMPSTEDVTYFSSVEPHLFSKIMMQYMRPGEDITKLKSRLNFNYY